MQEAAAVHGEDFQLRVPLQDAAEDEVMQRHRRVERIPDDVGEVVFLEALRLGEAERMQHDDGIGLDRLRPDRLEFRARQFLAVDVGEDLHALEAEIAHDIVEFLEGDRRILERDGAEAEQAVGGPDEGGHAVIDDARGLRAMLGGDVVIALVRRRRDHLEVDALRVEHGEPVLGIGEGDHPVLILADIRLACLGRREFGEGQLERPVPGLHELRRLRHERMRMAIDGRRREPDELGAHAPRRGRAVAVDRVAEFPGVEYAVAHLACLNLVSLSSRAGRREPGGSRAASRICRLHALPKRRARFLLIVARRLSCFQ